MPRKEPPGPRPTCFRWIHTPCNQPLTAHQDADGWAFECETCMEWDVEDHRVIGVSDGF